MGGIEDRAGLRGKRAAIIGGGYGLGRAVSLALAEAGVDLAICDIDAESLPDTVMAAEALGVSVFSESFDALDTDRLAAFYQGVERAFGQLDVLVNVVGGANMGFAFADTTPEDWADDLQRNFVYMLHSTKSALPLLRKSGRGGSIINFTTIEAHRGAATIAVYAGAKAATTNFSRSLANELGHEGIRVNVVAPDMTPSRGNERATQKAGLSSMGSFAPETLARSVQMACPLGTAPSPDAVANTVLFLASDLSSAITGTTLHTDGGTYAASGFLRWKPGQFSPLPPPDLLVPQTGS